MSLSIAINQTGYGMSTDIGTYRWNGHAFNPNGEGYGQTWNPWEEDWYGIGIYSAQSSFNVGNFQYGNEVVLYLIDFESDKRDSGYINFTWYDPFDEPLLSMSIPWSVPAAEYWYSAWVGIGLKHDRWGYKEIWTDGDYYVEADITYDDDTKHHYTQKFFTITNCEELAYRPGDYPPYVGKIWVEGTDLCYICWQGYKMIAKSDGSSEIAGEEYAGKIWVEGEKIAYVDSSGVKRKTKRGDPFGHHDWDELPEAPGTDYSGCIWVNDYMSDTYLMFIDESGVKRRVGAGYVLSGDYQ